MSSAKVQPTDPEATEGEARQYKTACDQELARSVVILGKFL